MKRETCESFGQMTESNFYPSENNLTDVFPVEWSELL
jgi:hypothetical protein